MFEFLDFLYVPAPDIEASIRYYKEVLAGELLWKIHEFGAWVACIRLSDEGPLVLLANHKKRNDLQLIYRVKDLAETASELRLARLEAR